MFGKSLPFDLLKEEIISLLQTQSHICRERYPEPQKQAKKPT